MVTPSDHELALWVRRGEVEAFGELVQRYQSSVFNVCFRLLGERQEAEDLAQEAFIRAYQRFDLYDITLPFGPWVRKVAANLCLNRLQAHPQADLALDEDRDADRFSISGNPEAVQERRERSEAVRMALASLPPRYRLVIELRHFHALSYTEIAAVLEIPLSDVKSHLFRARRLLADRLKAYG